MQSQPPREMSPSPTIRNTARALKTQSMPLVPSVMQLYNQQSLPLQQQVQQRGSPTSSQQSKRSPPPAISQGPVMKMHSPPMHSPPNNGSNLRGEVNPDRMTPPPPPIQSHSQTNIHQVTQPPTLPQHSYSQPNIHAHPRPMNRMVPPQFLSNNFQSMEESWQMTEQLMAEFEQAHGGGGSNPAAGTSGVAYAGGASSSSLSLNRVQSRTPPANHKDPVGDRVRANERMSPKEVDITRRREREQQQQQPQRTDSPNNRGRGSQQHSPQMQDHSSEPRSSPQYHTPLGTPGEHPAASYTQYRQNSYQVPRVPTPPTQRRASGMSPDVIQMRATPPAAIQARTPERDRSLPVQEEPEDDHGDHWGDDGRDSRADHRDDDDDDTLIEQENGKGQHQSRTEDEESYTPRSPMGMLPSEDLHSALYGPNNRLASLGKHHRNGSTDQLGLRSFDPELFENIPQKKEETREATSNVASGRREGSAPRHYVQEPQHHSAPPQYSNSEPPSDPYSRYGRLQPPQIPHPEDLQSFFDDPASAFIQAYLSSPRPMAPIPPTPTSHTAAPSPSPMISSIQPSPAPQIGSPYPYPFTHVRRQQTYPASPLAASSSYDPNHPSVIQEQLALQMQMYALNNHAPVSESNFSPATTPYPGASYNPWTFLQASRAFNGGRIDQSHSLHSSPSHEPVSLPMPHLRGRGIKKTKRSGLRKEHHHGMELPPRVESTQPRETSPEMSSGEETSTAGEADDKYEAQEEGNWVHGREPHDDSADWVDEDDDGEDGDLLDLEYHPQYVQNVEKRRRRWEVRWEALTQAFQALDRQTDATLVLMAAPSHSTKLHAITSRSLRRDTALAHSPSLSEMRSAFNKLASKRRISRANKLSLADRLMASSGSSTGGSDGSSEREEDLRRALQAALGSLGALGNIYEQREARWKEEMRRISDDRETVEVLLKQALGINPALASLSQVNGHINGVNAINGDGIGHAI
ncbi:hypothetical protein HWV62_15347 [Athelia sp. TMB]|nr:hypothetical protein HWV62_31957 [Athelia sp. TMB]KAF7984339.1 hypothetical protein HWV62_15347 [Athelia sp. TMB]